MPLPVPPATAPDLSDNEAVELRNKALFMALYVLNGMTADPERDPAAIAERVVRDVLPGIDRTVFIHADAKDTDVSACFADDVRERVAACVEYDEPVMVDAARSIPARAVLRAMQAERPPPAFNAYISIRNAAGDYYHVAWESLDDVDEFRMGVAEPSEDADPDPARR